MNLLVGVFQSCCSDVEFEVMFSDEDAWNEHVTQRFRLGGAAAAGGQAATGRADGCCIVA